MNKTQPPPRFCPERFQSIKEFQERLNNPPTGYKLHSWNFSGQSYSTYVILWERETA